MRIQELWRYPVKSMAGECLERAELGPDGVAGDRLLQVRDARDRVVTSRSRPALLSHRGTLGPDGEPLVDGRPWATPEVDRDVEAAAGPGARLVRAEAQDRFDILPLLVATDGAVAAFGHDRRRLRPNLLIGGVSGLDERDWEGRRLRVGSVVIELVDLRERCVMTTFDPDTQVQDVEVLRKIRRDFGGRLALNARVLEGGRIAVGDAVELIPVS
ncbi:MAG TPA: MOSC N-terminal beta barrel domain-containing protein [Planctomycetota bacterium]|nr:MOSC N-terminal beta barrel domain-containing protein [Planctomycetota bacterium]